MPTAAGWVALGKDISRRLRSPWANPKFLFYFVANVVGIAGVGLWITFLRYVYEQVPPPQSPADAVFEAAATYAIAVSATALADVMLSKDSLGSFVMLSWGWTILIGVSVGLAFRMPISLNDVSLWVICFLGVVMSLLQWWMINTDNQALAEPGDPTNATGGDPLMELQGQPAGQ